MIDNEKIAMMQAHYTKATYKHPEFCTRMLKYTDHREKEVFLNACRNIRKEEHTAQAILAEEIAEIYEAYTNGEKEHAIDECYDAIAGLVIFFILFSFIESINILVNKIRSR